MSLELKNIYKSFGDKKVISDFNFNFDDTGIYAIVGESGIGKTTLLRIISGLDKSFSGEIFPQKRKIAFVFQEYRLFPQLNAIENLIYAISNKKNEAVLKSAEEILYRLSFTKEEFMLLPGELSGGMKQRVSLARAFLYDAPILLLDEPTKELDENNANIVREIIAEEAKKRLVIIVSHNKEDISSLNATEIHLK